MALGYGSDSLGFNPDAVNAAINNINGAYSDLAQALGTEMQNQFVDYMSENWAAPNAQTYFQTKVDPTVNDLKSGIDKIFESVANTMNSAGQSWSGSTGRSFASVSFNRSSSKIDCSVIKDQINGVSGIVKESDSTAKSHLQAIMQKVEASLDTAKNAVASPDVSGFTQGASDPLANSLEKIKTNVSNATTELTEGLSSAVAQTVEAYQATETEIANAFSGN